jgi:hypothetical protein
LGKVEISALSSLRKNFFSLRENFPNASFHSRVCRACCAVKNEQTLTFQAVAREKRQVLRD